jgi:hypothetical protein
MKGFARQSKAPEFFASAADSEVAEPVMRITGRSGASARIKARNSMPLIPPGIKQSMRTTSICVPLSLIKRNPSSPVSAQMTSHPVFVNTREQALRICRSSSITRIRIIESRNKQNRGFPRSVFVKIRGQELQNYSYACGRGVNPAASAISATFCSHSIAMMCTPRTPLTSLSC